MNLLYLARERYLPDCTLGVLAAGPHKLFTLEPPWVPHASARGGVPHASCVAEGTYRARPWARPSGERVWLLSNAQLDVLEFPPVHLNGSAREGVRTLVMIHAAVHPYDVLDGIGVGVRRVKSAEGWVLEDSRDAMNRLRTVAGGALDLTLVIANGGGPKP